MERPQAAPGSIPGEAPPFLWVVIIAAAALWWLLPWIERHLGVLGLRGEGRQLHVVMRGATGSSGFSSFNLVATGGSRHAACSGSQRGPKSP